MSLFANKERDINVVRGTWIGFKNGQSSSLDDKRFTGFYHLLEIFHFLHKKWR